MKRILLGIITLALIMLAFRQEKKYTVTLTLNEWQAVVNSIDSKQVSALIERQIVPQLDTTKKK